MKKTGSKFLDSSAWLAYFFKESKSIKGIIDGEKIIFTSVISLYEIGRKLRKKKFHSKVIDSVMNFMQDRSVIIDITKEVTFEALKWKELHTVDALIYASSKLQHFHLITGDLDFAGLPKVEILDKK